MLPELEKLLIIQHQDQNIRQLEKQLANIPLEEEDIRNRQLEEKKGAATALANAQEVEIAIKAIELEVQTRRDSIAKLKVQQYQTKKNEEFLSMGEEIERYTKEVAELEDQELERMEELEGLNSILEEKKKSLAESDESIKTDIESLFRSRDNWQKEKDREQQTRKQASEQIDDSLLENYERTFKAKNGNAVVGLTDMQCRGCHMKVTKSTMIKVKAENEIAYCENCGRMLYYWTDDSDPSERGTSNIY